MPQYIYQHPKTGKTKEIFQSMNDLHVYEEDGIEWNRVFTVPQAAIDANADPFSVSQFDAKVANSKGTMGELYDRSAELSDKRASKRDGVDPLKKAHYDAYAKKCNGKRHMNETKEKLKDANFKI